MLLSSGFVSWWIDAPRIGFTGLASQRTFTTASERSVVLGVKWSVWTGDPAKASELARARTQRGWAKHGARASRPPRRTEHYNDAP